ncbi:MAG: NAD-binding protein [Oscillospiraceae bacterium]
MNVVVVGGGKVGYYLTKTLIEHGHKTCLIETNKKLCTKISNELDITVICGDGSTIDVLEIAKTDEADALISVTGKDEDNLIACQLAKKRFNVAKTVARVNNPKNEDVIRQLGVDIAVSSTNSIARLIEREVDISSFKNLLAINRGEATISQIELPLDFKLDAQTLSEIEIPDDCVIASITRKGQFIIPRGNTQLFAGDKILVIAMHEAAHKLGLVLGIAQSKKI